MWRSLISLPTTVIVILSGILGNLVQLLTLFVPSRPLSYRINSWIACSIWWMLHHLLFTINSDNKLEIVEDGDAIPKGESALVISNHVSAGDWFLINAVAHRKDMLGNARYFLKVRFDISRSQCRSEKDVQPTIDTFLCCHSSRAHYWLLLDNLLCRIQ